MIPRESPSRRIDFATFISISFPAFSLSNGTDHLAHKLYNKTKKEILSNLSSVSKKTTHVVILEAIIVVINGLYILISLFDNYRQENMVLNDSNMTDMEMR